MKKLFEGRKVEATSVSDFLARFYRPERYTGRGEDYAAALLASHQMDFDRQGYDIISHYDSVTGQVVAFFGPEPQPDPEPEYWYNPYDDSVPGLQEPGSKEDWAEWYAGRDDDPQDDFPSDYGDCDMEYPEY
jgi:hypothetical protein